MQRAKFPTNGFDFGIKTTPGKGLSGRFIKRSVKPIGQLCCRWDVIYAGDMLYKNAMGVNAIKVCLDYVKKNVECTEILDPFCGQGSVLKIANIYGCDAIGIDILPEQCKIAELI